MVAILHAAMTDSSGRRGGVQEIDGPLHAVVAAAVAAGFARVMLSAFDPVVRPARVVSSGLDAADEDELRHTTHTPEDWDRRLGAMERFRTGLSFIVEDADSSLAWGLRGRALRLERNARENAARASDPDPTVVVVPMHAADGSMIGVVVAETADRMRPPPATVQLLELLVQHGSRCIERARLAELAQERAVRLQRLQEVGGLLARSLDEREIVRELGRQAGRVMRCDGIVIAQPDLDSGVVTTALRIVRGMERARAPQSLGAGVIADVARTGRAVRLQSYDPTYVALAASDDLVGDGGPADSVLAVPMMLGLRLVGVLAVHASTPNAYTREDEEELRAMGSQAATAIANAQMYAESQRERRQSEALADIARAVGESLRLGDVLRLILRHAAALLRAEGACVTLEEDEDRMKVVAGTGSGDSLVGMSVPVSGSVSGGVLRSGGHRIVNDVTREPGAYDATRRAGNIEKTLIVSLDTAQGAIGVLSVLNRDSDFTEADARILQRLADQVTVAIVNARLFMENQALGERHRLVIETANDGIVITGRDRRLAFANPAAIELLGRPGSVIGSSVEDFVPAEQWKDVSERERRALLGEPQRYEAMIVRPDGERRVLAVRTAPMREGGEITGIVASLRDITEERRLMQQLLQKEKLAAIGQLVSGVAHELNNPLAGVIAFSQLLLASPGDGAARQSAVETIHGEARRAARIVANLLTFARQHVPERQETDINQALLDTIELHRYAMRAHQIDLDVALDPELPFTWADRFQLQQVFLNMITNAEYAVASIPAKGRITVRSEQKGDSILATIADNGPGMTAEQMGQIFNPFYTTKPVGEGTGLGLSIADGIIREHGGQIRVTSAPGEGTAFTVEIPVVEPPAADPARDRAKVQG